VPRAALEIKFITVDAIVLWVRSGRNHTPPQQDFCSVIKASSQSKLGLAGNAGRRAIGEPERPMATLQFRQAILACGMMQIATAQTTFAACAPWNAQPNTEQL
jgi:hypothetical protein